MIYQKEADLIERKARLKLTYRDLANALYMPPSTIANKLAGFIPLTSDERKQLEEVFDELENKSEGTLNA